MRSNEIFTPATKPIYTYYDRPALQLEVALLNAVDTPGMITTVSGPSKSGKTVLCENVIGQRSMLLVTGGGVSNEGDLWRKIRVALGLPATKGVVHNSENTVGGSVDAKASAGVFSLFSAEGGVGAKAEHKSGNARSSDFDELVGVDLLAAVAAAKRTLIVDDFHYIPKDVQVSLVEQFKEGARNGTTIVLVAVTHRLDDAIRANPDLRGRVNSIEVKYWSPEELKVIAELGFPKLNMDVPNRVVERLVKESLSSPQLMQSICLEFCRFVGVDDAPEQHTIYAVSDDQLPYLFKRVANTSSSHTALQKLETGPRVRGTPRHTYQLHDGNSGDVYTVVLKALASGEPKLTMDYAEIRERVASITVGEPPSGSSITSTLSQMDEAASGLAHEDRILEWDPEKETLNFSDPYFLYFLRWND